MAAPPPSLSGVGEPSMSPSNPAVDGQTAQLLQQQILQMQQQMQYLRQENTALKEHWQQQRVALSSMSSLPSDHFPSASSSSSSFEVSRNGLGHLAKPHKPELFTGERGSNAEQFIGSMNRFLLASGQDPTALRHSSPEKNREMVNYIAGFFDKSAGQWWDFLVRNSSEHQPLPATWDELQQKIRERFSPIAASKLARTQLDSIRQLSTVSVYCGLFLAQVQLITDMNESEQLHRFVSGLRQNIKMEVMRADPKSLHDAMNVAEKAEKFLQQFTFNGNNRGGNQSGRRNYFGPSPSSHGFAPSSSSTPMDLSHVRSNLEDDQFDDSDEYTDASESDSKEGGRGARASKKQQDSPQVLAMAGGNRTRKSNGNARGARKSTPPRFRVDLSREEIDRLRREGKCFQCQQTGHTVRNCPSRPSSQSKN